MIFSSASRSFQTSILSLPPISVVRTFTGDSQLTLMCAMMLRGKVDRDERHVGMAVQVVAAGRDDRFRLLADDVVHDRQIVRREVPHDADVVLKQAEVHARRVEVVERPERAGVDDLADLPDRAAEEEGVVHHDLQVLPLGQLDQLLGLLRRRRERLLDEDVLAVLEGRLRQLVVRPDRRDDGDGVDVRRLQDLREVGRQLHARIGAAARACSAAGFLSQTATTCAVLEAVEVADDVRTPVAVADDADADDVGATLRPAGASAGARRTAASRSRRPRRTLSLLIRNSLIRWSSVPQHPRRIAGDDRVAPARRG